MDPRVYTRGGDKGETGTAAGQRLPKDNSLLQANGTVDELSAHIALLSDKIRDRVLPRGEEALNRLRHLLQLLFRTGADLSLQTTKPSISADDVVWLEKAIDDMTAELPPLRDFLVPGGAQLLSQATICRTVTRRAERALIAATREYNLPDILQQLLNRLSDFFFTLERWLRLQLELPAELYSSRQKHEESDNDE